MVFDIRGFWADEKVDRLGWSKNSLKYKFFKALEIKLFKHANIVVTLTDSSKEFIEAKFKKSSNSVRVIRTCVDFSEFNAEKRVLRPYDFKRRLVLGYLGSIDTAYDFNAFLQLIKNLEERNLKVHLKILSKTTPAIVMRYLKENKLSHLEHEVLFLKRHELSNVINQFDLLGFALKPSFSLIASMPTKIAESLACGTPIICNYFNNDINKNADIILNALGGLKGPLMKVAQLLSTIPDALPKEYADKLQTLQAEAPSMGWLFVKRRMRTELGNDWEKKFVKFDKTAIKAASLGQVHQAIEKKSNKLLACKLQYPNMDTTITADLKQLKIILKIYKQIESTIDTEEIYLELKDRLYEEVDYKNSINSMKD